MNGISVHRKNAKHGGISRSITFPPSLSMLTRITALEQWSSATCSEGIDSLAGECGSEACEMIVRGVQLSCPNPRPVSTDSHHEVISYTGEMITAHIYYLTSYYTHETRQSVACQPLTNTTIPFGEGRRPICVEFSISPLLMVIDYNSRRKDLLPDGHIDLLPSE